MIVLQGTSLASMVLEFMLVLTNNLIRRLDEDSTERKIIKPAIPRPPTSGTIQKQNQWSSQSNFASKLPIAGSLVDLKWHLYKEQ